MNLTGTVSTFGDGWYRYIYSTAVHLLQRPKAISSLLVSLLNRNVIFLARQGEQPGRSVLLKLKFDKATIIYMNILFTVDATPRKQRTFEKKWNKFKKKKSKN